MLKHINFPDDLVKEIDAKRGDESFTSWIIKACQAELSEQEKKSDQLDRIENMLMKMANVAPSKTPQKAHSEVLIEDKPIVQPKPKKRTTTPQGELSEAQLIIIELHNSYSEQGLPKIDHLIAEELNNRGILTPKGEQWDNRRVMNTKTRLKKNGKL